MIKTVSARQLSDYVTLDKVKGGKYDEIFHISTNSHFKLNYLGGLMRRKSVPR